MISWSQHLPALLLAIASSTDNFALGFSVGMKRQSLSWSKNAFIALCNAAGALAASSVGGSAVSFAPPLLASTCFAYLGWAELLSWQSVDDGGGVALTFFMAVPMTLNNLAGGVAGGVTGMNAKLVFGYALVASLSSMACGHFLGNRIGGSFRKSNASLVAAVIYVTLSLVTLVEAYR